MSIDEFCVATEGKSLREYLGESVGSPSEAQELITRSVSLLKKYTEFVMTKELIKGETLQ